jgi:hypothetical protein
MKELSPFQRLMVWHLLFAGLVTLLLLPTTEPFNDAPTPPQVAVHLTMIFIVLTMAIRSWIEFISDYKATRLTEEEWRAANRSEEEWRAILDEILRVDHGDSTNLGILDEDEYDREFRRIFGDEETDPFRDDKGPL